MSPLIELRDSKLHPVTIRHIAPDHPQVGLLHLVALCGAPAALDPTGDHGQLDMYPYQSAVDAAEAVEQWADGELALGNFTLFPPHLPHGPDGVSVDIHATGAIPKDVHKTRVLFDGTSYGQHLPDAVNASADLHTARPYRITGHSRLQHTNPNIF